MNPYMNTYKTSDVRSSGKSGGISFCGLLAIVFITLKLAEIGSVANWSWWWVLSPLWVPMAIVLGFAVVCGIIAVIYE